MSHSFFCSVISSSLSPSLSFVLSFLLLGSYLLMYVYVNSTASDIMFNKKERKRLTINRNFVGDYCGFSENPSLRALVGEWAVLPTAGRPVDGRVIFGNCWKGWI